MVGILGSIVSAFGGSGALGGMLSSGLSAVSNMAPQMLQSYFGSDNADAFNYKAHQAQLPLLEMQSQAIYAKTKDDLRIRSMKLDRDLATLRGRAVAQGRSLSSAGMQNLLFEATGVATDDLYAIGISGAYKASAHRSKVIGQKYKVAPPESQSKKNLGSLLGNKVFQEKFSGSLGKFFDTAQSGISSLFGTATAGQKTAKIGGKK